MAQVATVAQVQPLAWEHPHVMGMVKKKKKIYKREGGELVRGVIKKRYRREIHNTADEWGSR